MPQKKLAQDIIIMRTNSYSQDILIFESTPTVIPNEWLSTGAILFSHTGDICQCWKVVWVALTKGCCGHLFVLYKDTSKYRTMFETAFTFHKKEQPGPNVSVTADETSNQSVHSAWAAEGLQKPSTVLAIDMWKYEGLYSNLTKTSGTKLQATTRKKSLSKRCA